MRAFATALLVLVLAACAAPANLPPAPVTVTAPAIAKPSRADEMAAYLAAIRKLDEAALADEATRQRENARREASDPARLKLALALAASPQSEEAEILALVEPMLQEGKQKDENLLAMAGFLQAMTLERRRLKEIAVAASHRSRDDKRALDLQKARAESLQDRNTQLQQKLEALSSLEKSLSNRKPQGK